jgi:hypothetical protein
LRENEIWGASAVMLPPLLEKDSEWISGTIRPHNFREFFKTANATSRRWSTRCKKNRKRSHSQRSHNMPPQIPGYLLAFESTVRPIVTIIALGLIWMGAARMKAPALSRYTTAGALSAALIAWVAVAQHVGAANTYFASTEAAVPTVLFGLLIPLMIAAMSLWLSGSIASLVSAIPLPWIVAAQIYRIGGGIFLVLWADGRLPWQFALPAGIGDVTTGGSAVVVAALLAQKAAGARRAAYAWCLFGIADLVVAITMGAMTSPGRAHLFALEAPNLLISSYPLVMVPTFAVPLALILHVLVLRRLRRETASTDRLVAT